MAGTADILRAMNDFTSRLTSLFERYQRVRSQHPGPAPWSVRFTGDAHSTSMVFSSIIHGNEVGPLEGLVEACEALAAGEIGFGGTVTLFLGNPDAARQDTRFLESDLNRVFLDDAGDTLEERRAKELMPLLDQADVYFDFHQTLRPVKQPFYIFPWSEESEQWVRAMRGAKVWVTRNPAQAFSPGMMCADEYVRTRGVPGVTLELGEQGWNAEAAGTTRRVIGEALALADAIAAGDTTLAAAAEGQPPVALWETVFRQTYDDPAMALRDDLVNFHPVAEGELLSKEGTPELRAPRDGAVLFPQFPPRDAAGRALDPRPSEIYRLVAPVDGDPKVLWG